MDNKEECWMIDVCDKYENTSNACVDSTFSGGRCNAGTKTIITILANIDEKLGKLTKE